MLVRSCNRQFAELGIGLDGFRRIKEEIRHFKERVARIAEDDVAVDRVFALNIQLVPHSILGESA